MKIHGRTSLGVVVITVEMLPISSSDLEVEFIPRSYTTTTTNLVRIIAP